MANLLLQQSVKPKGMHVFIALVFSWCTYQSSQGQTFPKNLEIVPFNRHDAFKQYCPCKNGGACLFKLVPPYSDDVLYNRSIHRVPRIERVNADRGNCYCEHISKGVFEKSHNSCHRLVDHCGSNPCRNGGRCLQKMGYYYCDRCLPGYGGQNCSELETSQFTWLRDLTIIWYPNSDFQTTSLSWFQISFSSPGSGLAIFVEYFGIVLPVQSDSISVSGGVSACYEMQSEDVACDTYVKGRNYYTYTLNAHSNFLAAPYNLIFGSKLERALNVSDSAWKEFKMYAVKYDIKFHVFNNKKPVFIQSLTMWAHVTSQRSACYPLIATVGCNSTANYPRKWLAHDLVKIQIVSRKQNNPICRSLLVELRDTVTFYLYDPSNNTPLAKRIPVSLPSLSKVEWQDNKSMAFEQKDKYFFGFDKFWIATFPLAAYGSYESGIWRELYMEFNVMCFIKTEPPHTLVTVEGGSRKVNCLKDVEFIPLNSNPSFHLEPFTLVWSCVDTFDPSNSICNPKTTGWTPLVYRSGELACDRTFHFKMVPYHSYFKTTSSNHSSAGQPYEWTIETQMGSTEIQIICKKQCDKVNPKNEVLLEAVESPFMPASLLAWTIFENNQILNLLDVTSPVGDPWTLSFKYNALKEGTSYKVLARTTRGKGWKEFVTNAPPAGGNCTISPNKGIKGVTEFEVKCRGWVDEDSPILYTLGTMVGDLFDPVGESTYYENFQPALLHHDVVAVTIEDRYGLKTHYPLAVVLVENGLVPNINKEVDAFSYAYSERDYYAMVNWIHINTEAATTAPQKVEIIANIYRTLDHISNLPDIGKNIVSLLKVLNGTDVVTRDEEGVSDMVLRAGEGLELAIDRVQERCSQIDGYYTMWDEQINNVVTAALSTADAIFRARDPMLEASSNANEGTQEVHRQKVKYGVWSTLRALQKILEQARKTMLSDQRPYYLTQGVISIFTAVGHGHTLKRYLTDFSEDGSSVSLSSRVLTHLGPSVYAIDVIRTENIAYSWVPISGQVLDIRFLKVVIEPPLTQGPLSKFEKFELTEGPFFISIKLGPSLNGKRIQGDVRLPRRGLEEHKLDRYTSLNMFKVLPGFGGVVVTIDPKHFGKIKMVLSHDRQPSYGEINSTKSLRRIWTELKYLNRNPAVTSDFYVAIISNGQVVYHYEANVTVLRCVVFISEAWDSQKCKYTGISQGKDGNLMANCECEHMSVISVDEFKPEDKITIPEDITLFLTIKDNFYVAAVLGFVAGMYILLLIWGRCRDIKNVKAKTIVFLVDNYPGDIHPYVIGVWTGKACRSGTTAKVAIRIMGENGLSRTHILRSPYRSVLKLASDDWFLLYSPIYLGPIKDIALWHNNGGCSADWFCDQITVYDLKSRTPYNFVVDRWFTVTSDLEQSKIFHVPLNKKAWVEDSGSTAKLFGDHFFAGIRESHIWTSIFMRHPRSMFTRCEKIAVLFTMIIITMLTSILFFGTGDFGASDLPNVSISYDNVIIAVKSWVIGTVAGTVALKSFDFAKKKERKRDAENRPPNVFSSGAVDEDDATDGGAKKKVGCCRKIFNHFRDNLHIDYLPILNDEAARYEKEHRKFNKWSLLAWIISTLTLLVCCYYITLYGLKFGKRRSIVWIETFVAGTIFDAFVAQPLQMALNSYIFAAIFKSSTIGKIELIVQYDSTDAPFRDLDKRLNYMKRRLRPEYKPMKYKKISRAAKIKACGTLCHEYVLFIIIASLIIACIMFFILSFSIQSQYFACFELKEHFSLSRQREVKDVEDIHKDTHLHAYIHHVALATLHRTEWYNNKPLKDEPFEPKKVQEGRKTPLKKGWVSDYSSKLVGVPRLRQQRMIVKDRSMKMVSPVFDDVKNVPGVDLCFKYPFKFLDWFNEDTGTYLFGWGPYEEILHQNLSNLWKYEDIFGTRTGVYAGRALSYHGGGYTHFLYWDEEESNARYSKLEMNNWIDNRTRVVFFEVNMYNVNVNLFISYVLIAEHLPSNVFVTRPEVSSASLLPLQSSFYTHWSLAVTSVLLVLLVIYFLYYMVESSRSGLIQSIMTFRGFFDFAAIITGLMLVNYSFDSSVRLSAFADSVDNLPRDQFLPLSAPYHNDFKIEITVSALVILIAASLAASVHTLMGNKRFSSVRKAIFSMINLVVLISLVMTFLVGALMKYDGATRVPVVAINFFLKELTQDLEISAPRVQMVYMIIVPFFAILMKVLLGTFISNHMQTEEVARYRAPGSKGPYKERAMTFKDPETKKYEKSVKLKVDAIHKKMNVIESRLDKMRKAQLKREAKLQKKQGKKKGASAAAPAEALHSAPADAAANAKEKKSREKAAKKQGSKSAVTAAPTDALANATGSKSARGPEQDKKSSDKKSELVEQELKSSEKPSKQEGLAAEQELKSSEKPSKQEGRAAEQEPKSSEKPSKQEGHAAEQELKSSEKSSKQEGHAAEQVPKGSEKPSKQEGNEAEQEPKSSEKSSKQEGRAAEHEPMGSEKPSKQEGRAAEQEQKKLEEVAKKEGASTVAEPSVAAFAAPTHEAEREQKKQEKAKKDVGGSAAALAGESAAPTSRIDTKEQKKQEKKAAAIAAQSMRAAEREQKKQGKATKDVDGSAAAHAGESAAATSLIDAKEQKKQVKAAAAGQSTPAAEQEEKKAKMVVDGSAAALAGSSAAPTSRAATKEQKKLEKDAAGAAKPTPLAEQEQKKHQKAKKDADESTAALPVESAAPTGRAAAREQKKRGKEAGAAELDQKKEEKGKKDVNRSHAVIAGESAAPTSRAAEQEHTKREKEPATVAVAPTPRAAEREQRKQEKAKTYAEESATALASALAASPSRAAEREQKKREKEAAAASALPTPAAKRGQKKQENAKENVDGLAAALSGESTAPTSRPAAKEQKKREKDAVAAERVQKKQEKSKKDVDESPAARVGESAAPTSRAAEREITKREKEAAAAAFAPSARAAEREQRKQGKAKKDVVESATALSGPLATSTSHAAEREQKKREKEAAVAAEPSTRTAEREKKKQENTKKNVDESADVLAGPSAAPPISHAVDREHKKLEKLAKQEAHASTRGADQEPRWAKKGAGGPPAAAHVHTPAAEPSSKRIRPDGEESNRSVRGRPNISAGRRPQADASDRSIQPTPGTSSGARHRAQVSDSDTKLKEEEAPEYIPRPRPPGHPHPLQRPHHRRRRRPEQEHHRRRHRQEHPHRHQRGGRHPWWYLGRNRPPWRRRYRGHHRRQP